MDVKKLNGERCEHKSMRKQGCALMNYWANWGK